MTVACSCSHIIDNDTLNLLGSSLFPRLGAFRAKDICLPGGLAHNIRLRFRHLGLRNALAGALSQVRPLQGGCMALVGAPAAPRGDRGQVFMGLRDGSRGKSETCGWGFPTCARGPLAGGREDGWGHRPGPALSPMPCSDRDL